jgi:hypothetical protein
MISARFGALWLVAAALVAGVLVIAFGSVRWGGFVLCGGLFGGALIRLVLPKGRAGALVVRSRTADVLFLLVMAIGLLVIVITLDLRPRG